MLATIAPEVFKSFVEQAKLDIGHFQPELLLVLVVSGLIFANAFMKRVDGRLLAWPALLGTLGALWLVIARYDATPVVIFSQSLRIDRFANFFSVVFLVGTAVTILLASMSKELADRPMGEFYAILLSAVIGMMLMAEAVDLLMIFVAVELLSVPSYVLTGWIKKSKVSSEAALKYVIYGSVSAGLMLYGFSLFYGMTGSVKLSAIGDLVKELVELLSRQEQPEGAKAMAAAVGLAAFLSFAGFAYKMAAVPMQFWAPDVYQGAPTAVTAWLSVTSKAAGVAIFIRFMDALGLGRVMTAHLDWVFLVGLISAITMTLGNLGALHQTNVKRMLAYSSVAHVGYILMGVAAFGAAGAGWQAVAFYVVAYLLMNLGAFSCVILGANELGNEELASFKGLAYRAPRLAFAFAIFLISLIGIPPTAGFSGKFQLFVVAVNQGLIWLAVVAAVNTAISAYYYAKVLKTMFLEEAPAGALRVPALGELLVAAHVAAVVYLGVFFNQLVGWTREIGPLR